MNSWYPMRVTYQRELTVKEELDRRKVENFLPMRYALVEGSDGGHTRLVPAVHNLIFLRSTRSAITELKTTIPALEPLRYIMKVSLLDDKRDVLTVPDKQMDDFIRVATADRDQVLFLEQSEYLQREGTRVRIIEGAFAGVEGVIKRIKRNRHVVVSIADIAAVALMRVPTSYLQVIE